MKFPQSRDYFYDNGKGPLRFSGIISGNTYGMSHEYQELRLSDGTMAVVAPGWTWMHIEEEETKE